MRHLMTEPLPSTPLREERRLTTWALLAGLCAGLCAGCASSSKKTEETPPDSQLEIETYVPIDVQDPDAIGAFLTGVDREIQEWSGHVLGARNDRERRKAMIIERNLTQRTRERQAELIEQLEVGPPTNRIVAAAAVGFTRAEAAHSPLLAAIEDEDPRVVSNALLGLAILQRPDTPLDRIGELLGLSPDPIVRAMAAYAARHAGQENTASAERLIDAARIGLVDEDAFVRSQCILLLAEIQHTDSIGDITDRLRDDVPLVSASAVRGLLIIGMEDEHYYGEVARSLTDTLRDVEGEDRRRILRALIELSERNLGTDAAAWREWSQRLP